jgi:hypothetical protein
MRDHRRDGRRRGVFHFPRAARRKSFILNRSTN